MKFLIGIDLGTTGTKAGLFDSEGHLLADAYRESTLYYPKPGWVEQHPADFYTSTCETIQEVLKKAGIHPKDVAALSIDGQMGGVMGIDEEQIHSASRVCCREVSRPIRPRGFY